MADLPVVLVLSARPIRLQSSASSVPGETRELDCRWYVSDENLQAILVRERPDVIASFGRREAYPRLLAAPDDVRRRWLHFDGNPPSPEDLERAGAMVFCLFLHRALDSETGPIGGGNPLVSVFTPAFRPGDRILRAHRSLRSQSYDHWEWVVVDDSDDGGTTLALLAEIAQTEPRMSLHPSYRQSGRIGEVKRRACALSRGEILVELDHDDELPPDALAEIVRAFQGRPDVGFVYSDWAVVAEDDGAPLSYGEGWAFGYGAYRRESLGDRELLVCRAAPLNAETLRHIVGVPNHVRAWRRDAYWAAGGHNAALHVADDYELLVRTFLSARTMHIPKLCYIQHQASTGSAQDVRRGEIQRLVRCIRDHYDDRIQKRLEELREAPAVDDTSRPVATKSAHSDRSGARAVPRIPCLLLAYFDSEVVRRTLEGLVGLEDRLAVFLIENGSPHSDRVREAVMPYVRSGLVARYLLFPNNIGNNTLPIVLRQQVGCADQDLVIVGDCDLVAQGPWLDESVGVMRRHPEVFTIGGSLDLRNLPLATFPDAGGWVPPDIADGGDYVEALTGPNFLVFRGPDLQGALDHFDDNGLTFRDDVLHAYCYRVLGKRWARTRVASFRHLTWDSYQDLTHPYTRMKMARSWADHWDHARSCSYVRIA